MRGHTLGVYNTNADPGGADFFALHPLLLGGTLTTPRFPDLCAVFQLYKYRKLEAVFLAGGSDATPSIEASGILVAVAPTEGSSSSNPTPALVDCDHSAYTFAGQATVARLRLPSHVLHGQKDYYSTGATTDAPCNVWIGCIDAAFVGVAGKAAVVWNWEIEWYGRTPTTVTLNRLRDIVTSQTKEDDDHGVVVIPPCCSCTK
jgi:hypothetical protein